jgi:hypothetical protein
MTAHVNQCLQALRRRGQFAEASVFSVENEKKLQAKWRELLSKLNAER